MDKPEKMTSKTQSLVLGVSILAGTKQKVYFHHSLWDNSTLAVLIVWFQWISFVHWLGWCLGRISSWKRLSNTSKGSSHPCRNLKATWMWHLEWLDFVILEGFSNINGSVIPWFYFCLPCVLWFGALWNCHVETEGCTSLCTIIYGWDQPRDGLTGVAGTGYSFLAAPNE